MMSKKHKHKIEEQEEDSGLELVEKPEIYIPRQIADTMRYIYNHLEDIKISQGSEFSIFCKAKIEGFQIEILPEFFIPKQYVHGAEVDYDENRPDFDYNVVIHRHPSGCENFSNGDDEYINRNFDISLLWTAEKGFVKGQYNLYKDRQRLVIPCELGIMSVIDSVPNMNKIRPYSEKPKKEVLGYTIEEDDTSESESDFVGPAFPFYSHERGCNVLHRWDKKSRTYRPVPSSRDNWDKLNGSSVIDSDGNIVPYTTTILANTEEDDSGAEDISWIKEAINYFDKIEDESIKTEASNIAMQTEEVLDSIEKDYSTKNVDDTIDFSTLSYIAIASGLTMKWEDNNIKTFVERIAKNWVNNYHEAVRRRVKKLYQTMISNEIKKLKTN